MIPPRFTEGRSSGLQTACGPNPQPFPIGTDQGCGERPGAPTALNRHQYCMNFLMTDWWIWSHERRFGFDMKPRKQFPGIKKIKIQRGGLQKTVAVRAAIATKFHYFLLIFGWNLCERFRFSRKTAVYCCLFCFVFTFTSQPFSRQNLLFLLVN